ncbi:metalloendopeptidase [Lecanora helva]
MFRGFSSLSPAFRAVSFPLRSKIAPSRPITQVHQTPFRLPSKLLSRQASQWGPKNTSRPAGNRQKYDRFNRNQQFYDLWNSPNGYRYGIVFVGLGCGVLYYNLERVPVTGRLRFNCISPYWEEQLAGQQDQMILSEHRGQILSSSHPYSKMVNRVLQRLIPASGQESLKWEVHVINDPHVKNAFVMPGGKVFVFSGIIDICDSEDGLAAILGHEIAHQQAHHMSEKISKMVFLIPIIFSLWYFLDVSGYTSQYLLDLLISRPGSRKMESEADYLGLLMMSQACYDPDAAVKLWQIMKNQEQYAPPQFLSTHPASENRVTRIQGWLPEAYDKRAQSQCGSTIGFADQFKRAVAREDDFWFG